MKMKREHAEEWRKPTETGGPFDHVVRDAHDKEELAEDLAIARQAVDEYGKGGVEGTISYNEYRRNRQMSDAGTVSTNSDKPS